MLLNDQLAEVQMNWVTESCLWTVTQVQKLGDHKSAVATRVSLSDKDLRLPKCLFTSQE